MTIVIPPEALKAMKKASIWLTDGECYAAALALLEGWPGMFDVPGDVEFPRKLIASDYIILPLPTEDVYGD